MEIKNFLFITLIFLVILILIFYNTNNIKHFTSDSNNIEVLNKIKDLSIKLNYKSKELETIQQKINLNDIKLINTIKDLSIRLKNKSQQLGQLECKLAQDQVSNSGGWCSKISGLNSTLHLTDTNLANGLSEFLKNKEVASFGDGPGAYKTLLTNLNQVKLYDAYDGAPYTELTTNDNVKFLDLSQPIYHLKKYDWIISLEVAEHIPAEFENIYLDNLVRHAKEGIILSWAKLGQDGHSHVNNRDVTHVIQQMEIRNFTHNKDDTELLKGRANFHWLKNNINVYRRKK